MRYVRYENVPEETVMSTPSREEAAQRVEDETRGRLQIWNFIRFAGVALGICLIVALLRNQQCLK
jgi:hypothetical protein